MLLALVGVIDPDKPVSAGVVDVVATTVEVDACTTCNTEPAGKPVVVALVNTVPELSGKFSVRSVELSGLAMVNVPVPERFPLNAIRDNLFLLAEFDAFATKGVAIRL